MTHAAALLTAWEFAPVPSVALIAAGAAYGLGASRVTREVPAHPWQRRRTACFMAGLAVAAFAVVGPPGAFDDVFFYAHMTQHILLTMVAAPLLVLGDPVLLALRASTRATRRRVWVPLLRSSVVRAATNPVVGWIFFVGVMAATHLPRVYDGFLAHPILHDYLEHPLYLLSAVVYFHPLLVQSTGARPVPHWIRLVSLFTMMVPMAMVGFAIFAVPHVAYSYYAHVARPFGPATLADQHLAGILMWSTTMVTGVVWLTVAGYHWLQHEEQRTRRHEDALARLAPQARA